MSLFAHARSKKNTVQNLSFGETMQTVELMVSCAKSPLEKVRAYNYAMFVIGEDFAAYGRTLMFRKRFLDPLPGFFPDKYYLDDGTPVTFRKKGKQAVSLQNHDNVFVTPWECSRLVSVLQTVYSKGFVADDNHKAFYYTEIDTAIVHSGNHSIGAGIFFDTGNILADVFDVAELYGHVDTDGENWLNRHNGQILTSAPSIHIAILYEISRQRYELLAALDHDEAEYCRINGGAFTKSKKSYTLVCGTPHSGKASFLETMHGAHNTAVYFDGENFDALLNQCVNIIEKSVCFGCERYRMQSARANGYFVKMIFIGVDINESIRRSGTADTAESEFIVQEKLSSIEKQMPQMLKLCDEAEFFDNEDGFKRLAHWDGNTFSLFGNKVPDWFHLIHMAWLNSLSDY